jgi:hypothetical protein
MYDGYKASVGVDEGRLVGSLPVKQLKLVRHWRLDGNIDIGPDFLIYNSVSQDAANA